MFAALSFCEEPVERDKLIYVYDSTSEGSKLMYHCKDTVMIDSLMPSAIPQCYLNGSWAPDPDKFHCRSM